MLLLAILLAGVGVWYLLREDEAVRAARAENEASSGPAVPKAPKLLGTGELTRGRAGGPKAKAAREEAAPLKEAPAPPARKRPKQIAKTMRVLDAAGRPAHRAQVTVRVAGADGERRVSASTTADGRATLYLPEGKIISVKVIWSGTVLLSREDALGIDLGRLGDVRSEERYVLSVRTVDSGGVPRPRQRVLYRPRVEGKQATGWTGGTSDAEGWCRLGPYALGTLLEIRAGPRGLEKDDIADPTTWQPVRVDGGEVELIVGEEPRLQLAFPAEPVGTRLTIAVLNLETGAPVFPPVKFGTRQGTWTAEALTAGMRLEVVVFDARRGRFARLRDLVPTGRPIEVRLEPGVPVSGRVILAGARSWEGGTVRAVGRGLDTSVPIDSHGRFRFKGLPDESLVLHARAQLDQEGNNVWFTGQAERTRGSQLNIPVGRELRLTVRLKWEGKPSFVGPFTLEATSQDWQGQRSLKAHTLSHFYLNLPAGRWHLTARGVVPGGPTLEAMAEVDLRQARSEVLVLPMLQVAR